MAGQLSSDGAAKFTAALRAEYIDRQGPMVGRLMDGTWGGGLHPADREVLSGMVQHLEDRLRNAQDIHGELQRIGMELGQPGGYPMQPGGFEAQPGGVPTPQPAQQAMCSSPALAALQRYDRVEVKEKARAIEALTALLGAEIEMANKYGILGPSGDEILFAVEQTDCFRRNLKQCFPDCTSWEVDIHYTEGGASQRAFRMERPYTCTCCCFNRPVMTMLDANTGEVLGSMRDPCACCGLTFSMQDPSGTDVLAVKGGCCQWGLCCPLPCGPCSEVSFDVKDAQNGENVGHIQKTVPSCCKFCFASDVDNYKVDFGGVTHPQFKALLIGMAIFMDFRYFNNSRND